MYALMQKFTLIVSLSQSDSNLKSKREHQIAIENTTSSYRFDELFLRIVKIEHRIDQDVSSINSLIKKKLVEAQMTANSKTCMRFFFVYCCHLCALGGPIYISTDTGAGLNSGRLSLTKALVWKSTDTGLKLFTFYKINNKQNFRKKKSRQNTQNARNQFLILSSDCQIS